MTDKLPEFRRELDEVDEQLLVLLSRRMCICREVARYKSEAGVPMMQADRVAQVKARAMAKGKAAGLSEGFVLALYETVIAEACRIESEIIDSSKRDRVSRDLGV